MNKQDYREVLGQRLKEFREIRNITVYAAAKKGGIRIDQIQSVESGESNYTIDTFLGYIVGCNLYMYFAEKAKDGDFKSLLDEAINSNPNPE